MIFIKRSLLVISYLQGFNSLNSVDLKWLDHHRKQKSSCTEISTSIRQGWKSALLNFLGYHTYKGNVTHMGIWYTHKHICMTAYIFFPQNQKYSHFQRFLVAVSPNFLFYVLFSLHITYRQFLNVPLLSEKFSWFAVLSSPPLWVPSRPPDVCCFL